VSQKWAANGAISAVLVRIAYRFVALQMEIFSQYRERRERCIIARVLEVKKEIPAYLFFCRRLRFLGRCAPGIFERYEVAFSPIDGEQIRDHLPSYGQRRSISIPFLLF
jgi:hypothetical protein